ncbi:MAG: nitroreductase family deazaflavin-dependent oxidoreductase [Candidatus Binatia bacterium]
MVAIKRNKLTELFWKVHAWCYRVSGGRLGATAMGMPVLLLTTTGRRSGEPRTVALMYLPRGDDCVVIASNAGEPRHPAWWLNLERQPEAVVQRGSQIRKVRAREALGEEREGLWAEVIGIESSYTTYEGRTSRRIPVVVLEPV